MNNNPGHTTNHETVDFSQVVELPHHKATREQLSMMYTRYRFARDYCQKKLVLELSCGGGMGLGYLAQEAERIVGCDIDHGNLGVASQHCSGNSNVQVVLADAHNLPFSSSTFDVVLLLDSLYFFEKPFEALQDAKRVLKDGSLLLISMVNPSWKDFNPSPVAHKYFTSVELAKVLSDMGFQCSVFGAFVDRSPSLASKFVSAIRRLAIRLRLMPTRVRFKEILKRVFYGKLNSFGREVRDGMGEYGVPVLLENPQNLNADFKITYLTAMRVD